MKATLARSGGTGFATANWKSFDVWGGERSSTGSGSMFGYCGNLGHPTDPENGLIYMRARFYEPWTGRFLSEDVIADGSNWYVYAESCSTSFKDFDGLRIEFFADGWTFWFDTDKGMADIHIIKGNIPKMR
jgi:RHS repeat-associated protein